MKTEFKEGKIRSLLPTNENIKNIFQAELAKYSQVKYPGLQINSRIFVKDLTNIKSTTDLDDTNFWISLMVSSDPFYMIGPNLEALQTSFSSYPETYQRRVRLYQWNDKRDLSILPQDQFNIIFCWDFFNYLTIETIDQFLSQMIRLLRPGGTLLFTYNNCDLADSARLVDFKLAGWTTPKLLEAIYLKLGFELDSLNDIISDETNISHVSWMKLKRPGELITVKMSQAQGLIGRK
jgi:SAM-dependent methyltransferase